MKTIRRFLFFKIFIKSNYFVIVHIKPIYKITSTFFQSLWWS